MEYTENLKGNSNIVILPLISKYSDKRFTLVGISRKYLNILESLHTLWFEFIGESVDTSWGNSRDFLLSHDTIASRYHITEAVFNTIYLPDTYKYKVSRLSPNIIKSESELLSNIVELLIKWRENQ